MEAPDRVRAVIDKVHALGGTLAPPAGPAQLAAVEARLGLVLPGLLRAFLLQHDGSARETTEGWWRFWPCAEITTYAGFRRQDWFRPDRGARARIDPAGRTRRLAGTKLLLFADVLIDLPTYGVYLDPGHPCDGMVFDTTMGYLSTFSFGEWMEDFAERAEETLLLV